MLKNRKKKTYLILFLIICFPNLFSNEVDSAEADDFKYQIINVEYEIKGLTKKNPLSQAVPIEQNKIFLSKKEFDKYIDHLHTEFGNMRTIESFKITPEFLPPVDNIVNVRLNIFVKDTWNIIALPYPSFNSNSGLQLKLKVKDFNFAGFLQPMNVDFIYRKDEKDNSSFLMNGGLGIPFKKGPVNFLWDISSSIGFVKNYYPSFNLSTGLEVSYKFKIVNFYAGVSNTVNVNSLKKKDQNIKRLSGTEQPSNESSSSGTGSATNPSSSAADDIEPASQSDVYYISDKFYTYFVVELYNTDKAGTLTWSPFFSVSGNWKFKELTDQKLKGADIHWSHILAIGKVNWHKNFRHGYSFELSNSYSYNTYKKGNVGISFAMDATGFYSFIDRVGLSGRVQFYYNFFNASSSVGSRLRGILDRRLSTDTAVSVNFDLPIKIGKFKFEEITGINWTRFFGFELHIVPFLDMALTHDEKNGTYFNPKDGWYSGGFEIIVYPIKMRSIYGRVSLGYDLSELKNVKGLNKRKGIAVRDGDSISEIFIGIGLHY